MRRVQITFRLPKMIALEDLPLALEATTAKQFTVDYYVAFGPATVDRGSLKATPGIVPGMNQTIRVVAFVLDAAHGIVGRCEREATVTA